MKKWSKKKKILLGLLVIFLAISGYVANYLSFSYKADEQALQAMVTDTKVIVENLDDRIVLKPIDEDIKAGFIFYPGGQVEPESHAYTGYEIAKNGYMVVIPKMPFNLAIFGINRSNEIMNDFPEIDKWYQGGFSLGGAMSCVYAKENFAKLQGLILYAGYTTEKYDLSQTDIKVKSISAELDGLATKEKINEGKKYMPSDTIYVEIKGGDHTQFGVYGDGQVQKGDNPAEITREEQQKIMIEETLEFLESES
ncbi:alpha/beta hydrolase [Clostridium grantii]|uniref:Alpha/beta hydrolase family protein n=1 Tax=Clostridium grantii DSM 8605 TaxID=1121316 RepID=A0A1M5V8C2_9CLOT|nr:alpha/beta hydrolase [Clostridium grantii]SHH71460.1 Alpha/beta hydrolase family protein [Clostridium grantii DSM 8605]